jgi:hypothetical protein
VVVSNPLGWTRTDFVRLTLPLSLSLPGLTITDAESGQRVAEVQIVVDAEVRRVQTAWFLARGVPPFGMRTYYVQLNGDDDGAAAAAPELRTAQDTDALWSNGVIGLDFDSTGRVSSFVDSTTTPGSAASAVPLQHELLSYSERQQSDIGNVCTGSNVYTFVPVAGQAPVPLVDPSEPVPLVDVAAGPFVWERSALMGQWGAVTYRMMSTGTQGEEPLVDHVLEVQTLINPRTSPRASLVSSAQPRPLPSPIALSGCAQCRPLSCYQSSRASPPRR